MLPKLPYKFATQNSVGSNISYIKADVLGDGLKPDQFDIVCSGLFSHHFADEEWIKLITKMYACSKRGVILTDLHRHWLLYYAVWVITHLFTRNKMVRIDGPLSVKRSFKKAELVALLKSAQIDNYNLTWVWPFRWLLVVHK
jgi:2-polyprenyl-3-methyl-5-hydroxy-6-metoxy-1,4-benzoquinol methylase